MNKKSAVVLIAVICFSLFLSSGVTATEKKPVEVVMMSTPFGTLEYNIAAAYEQVFREANSWVRIKHQETPGAMYVLRYIVKNRQKMIDGQVNHTVWSAAGVGGSLFMVEGRWPFEKFPWPDYRTLVSGPGILSFYVTDDPDIKTLADLGGKRVGTAEKARPFMGVLLDKPLFGNALGIYDRIKWAPLGDVGCKEAFINGKIDGYKAGFGALIDVDENGRMFTKLIAPSPPAMEVLSSGRKLHLLPVKPEWIQKGYNPAKDLVITPVLVKKEAIPDLAKEDFWATGAPTAILCDSGLPGDVAAEIVRVRHEYRAAFAKFHASLAFMPSTPYPFGTPGGLVHEGVAKAMDFLGLPIPKQ